MPQGFNRRAVRDSWVGRTEAQGRDLRIGGWPGNRARGVDFEASRSRHDLIDHGNIDTTAGQNTDAKTSVDWDLKNFAGIPIAGGVYLIHVKADGLGERTIKWFGILRPVDLNSL